MERETLLSLEKATVHYGGVCALERASVALNDGEIVAVMGPNGAGKSTVLKAMFGIAPVSSGAVRLHGHPITPVPHKIVYDGIAFVPQGRRVFPHLTVQENLEVGGFIIPGGEERERRIEEAMAFFPVLARKRRARAGSLSGGEQQMLALARGLMADPKVLLLDEPSLGLAPKLVREVFDKIAEINRQHHVAIMIVEHNIRSLLAIVNRCYVLDKGVVIAEGTPAAVERTGVLEKVFLGKLE